MGSNPVGRAIRIFLNYFNGMPVFSVPFGMPEMGTAARLSR